MSRFIPSRERWKIRGDASLERLPYLRLGLVFVFVVIIVRLFVLQVLSHDFYSGLASGQRDLFSKLSPTRGDIYVRDTGKDELYPVATNAIFYVLYAEPRKITDPKSVARRLAPIIGIDESDLFKKLDLPDDPYEPLLRRVSEEKRDEISALGVSGIGFTKENVRVYPEERFGGHILGFVGEDESGKRGRYGLEGYFDKELGGTPASITGEKTGVADFFYSSRKPTLARDGSDLVLTIDRTIQFVACEKLREAVRKHDADGGTVIIMEPDTGAILAMCSVPDYDPNKYGEVADVSVFNNPAIFFQYEPGSVFKAMTMAAAIDMGKVGPQTIFEDTGSVKIGSEEIKNSDLKAHGLQTMTEVLDESLNTGAVFAMRQMGAADFRRYVKLFGFGQESGVELFKEISGDISSLDKRGEIYAATASFGQGIAVTPLQVVTAFATIANGGNLMKPYIIDEIKRSDGTVAKNVPRLLHRVLTPRASTLVGSMLVSVVANGHGKRAGVPGYYVAGKTGTAQVPRRDGKGYEKDVTVGSFVGFAPLHNPRFVMLTRIDHPRDVQWAESTAAPLFGSIANFLLQYMKVPPERD